MSAWIKKRHLTPERIFGKLSLIPAQDQREHVALLKAKLDVYRHLARCVQCLGADASCDQCALGSRLNAKLEGFYDAR